MGNKTRYTANLVSDNNIFVDIVNDRVGIGSTQPTAKLNVLGIVSATSFVGDGSALTGIVGGGSTANINTNSLVVSGISTLQGNVIVTGYNQLRFGGGQNSFLYVGTDNDTRLQTNNNELLIGGPTVRLQSYSSVGFPGENFLVATKDGSVDLYHNNALKFQTAFNGITVYGDVTLSGSGSEFVGSGAGLTSLPAGQLTGALPAIDGSALTGIVGGGSTANINTNSLVVSGISTLGYTTVSELNVTGVSTFLKKIEPKTIQMGELTNLTDLSYGFEGFNGNGVDNTITLGNDLVITHLNDSIFGRYSWIAVDEYPLVFGTKGEASSNIYYSDVLRIEPGNDSSPVNTSYVQLRHGTSYTTNEGTLTTIGTGVTVTGEVNSDRLNVSGNAVIDGSVSAGGSITANTFYGNFSGSITDATNLTGGYANASQLNVTGITTISAGRIQADASSNLRFGNIAAGSGSTRNIAIGDQVLTSLSGGSGRNIGIGELSYYDTTTGQYNIGIGINAGQKITTGSYNVILGGYNGQSGLDLRTSSNNVVIADGQGNIRQYIDSNGNVGIKTTVVTEALTVAGVVSATSFYGTLNSSQLTGALPALDGSALTGVTAIGSGIEIRNNGSAVGTASTVDFSTGLDVTPVSAGVVTVTAAIPGISTTGTSVFNDIDVANRASIDTCVVESGAEITGYTTFRSGPNLVDRLAVIGDSVDSSGRPGLIIGNTSSSDTTEYTFKMGQGNQGRFWWKNNNGLTGDSITWYHTGTYYLRPGGTNSSFRIVNKWHSSNPTLISDNYIRLYWGDNSGNTYLRLETTTSGITAYGNVTLSGSGSQFVGSGAGLTSIPSGELTGALPAIDGSALLNVNATGDGIVVEDNAVNVGSARTVNFGTGLDVTYSASGIATVNASGGSLQSRTIVSGTTSSLTNLGIGNTNITGFKSYALMKVGLSTAGWLRLYTDSSSRDADVSRSIGEDPSPGSGVIAEVITTGISTNQIISPFVMGGNLNDPADTTIYASIKNLSGSTQTITANLTILQLEA